MISWRMAAAWVSALVVATVLTWQIVGLADSQVGETPVAMVSAPTTTVPGADTSATPITTPSTTTPTSEPGTTPSTSPVSPTSSGSPSSSAPHASTSSSAPGSTAVTAEWSVRTVNSPGGTVVLRHRPGEVELQAATPVPGFGVEVDDDGPDRVRVEFESANADIRVEARWESGSLVVDIDI